MDLKGKKVGIGITGSFCTLNDTKTVLKKLSDLGADIYPFASVNVTKTDTRFGKAEDFVNFVKEVTGREPITVIKEAEQFGPFTPLDIMVMLPLTGSSLNKFATGINDSAPLMAAKTTLRNNKPVVVAMFSNDALGLSGMNIMKLINSKNIYFVPFGQDNYVTKPFSMIANLDFAVRTVELALEGKQLQPVVIENFKK